MLIFSVSAQPALHSEGLGLDLATTFRTQQQPYNRGSILAVTGLC
jgi:hypothetical protein